MHTATQTTPRSDHQTAELFESWTRIEGLIRAFSGSHQIEARATRDDRGADIWHIRSGRSAGLLSDIGWAERQLDPGEWHNLQLGGIVIRVRPRRAGFSRVLDLAPAFKGEASQPALIAA
jgi:hypothetical protein